MNRREFGHKFLLTLAGIPLLRLLVKVPEKPTEPLGAYLETLRNSTQDATLSIGDVQRPTGLPEGEAYWYIDARAPYRNLTTASNTTSGLVVTYWDGQQWIPMRVEIPRSWTTGLA